MDTAATEQAPNATASKLQGRKSKSTKPAKPGEVVCRYCGSDDLAPSFKKRGDARCRACFKKRYGGKKYGASAKRAASAAKAKTAKTKKGAARANK